jgi:hypothetical protein
MSARFVASGSAKSVSESKATSKTVFAVGELTNSMLAGMREIRAKALSVEDINRRCLEAMKGRGKYR